MSTHNIAFYEEMAKIIFPLSSNTYFICYLHFTTFFIKTKLYIHILIGNTVHTICSNDNT